MTTVAYCHPLVPPEWIAAHGLRPRWLQPEGTPAGGRCGAVRGMCAYAAAVVDAARGDTPRLGVEVPVGSSENAAGLVLVTVCDHMRFAAAEIERHGRQPVFLFNVPSTWQTPVAREVYLEELRRLGRHFPRCGRADGPDGGV